MSSNDDAGRQAGQFWTTVEEFPKPKMTKFFFHADGSVSKTAPTEQESSTSFTFDPLNPQTTKGGNNLFSDAPCGPLDQQEIDTREDVIVFQTPVLTEELVLTGPINGYLSVSSSAIDTDIMVNFIIYYLLSIFYYLLSIMYIFL